MNTMYVFVITTPNQMIVVLVPFTGITGQNFGCIVRLAEITSRALFCGAPPRLHKERTQIAHTRVIS
jgi:hypothetical protein